MTNANCDELRERALAIRQALQARVDATIRERHPGGGRSTFMASDFVLLTGDERALAEEMARLIVALRDAGCPELPATVER